MWACFRENIDMAEFLLENGADKTLVDEKDCTCLDLAVIRMNYKTVLFLVHKAGMVLREKDWYAGKLWRDYDIDMFFKGIEDELPDID
jgi:ankyrin repeat protein